MRLVVAASAFALAAQGAVAQNLAASPNRPDQAAFRATYKELVETNTSLSAGDCTLAAQRMAARLKAAGYPDGDLHVITAPGHPKEGGLVAVYPGRDTKAKAILLLAHLDVVEAKREDWTRDPFILVEENGYFYGRGAFDDKAMAAIWVDTLVRYRQEGFKPRRAVKVALTCGEETSTAFNGAADLARNHRDLIDAAFALNEGGGGRRDAQGKPVWLSLQVGEKLPQDYRLEVTNPGGHSARPIKDNAIVRMSAGLVRLGAYDFPMQLSDVTRGYFAALAKLVGGDKGAAMNALIADPADKAAEAEVSADPVWNATLRTTCIPTLIDGGHANNAQPQRVRVNVNCRLLPGADPAEVSRTLSHVLADPQISVTTLAERSAPVAQVPLTPAMTGPVMKLAAQMFPGTPVLTTMATGASDGAFLTPAGIPTYGAPGLLSDADGDGVHGLNERIAVKALYDGRDFLYRLVKLYAEQP